MNCPICDHELDREELMDERCHQCGYRPRRDYVPSKPLKRTARVSRELLADPHNCICPQDTNGTDPSCPVHSR